LRFLITLFEFRFFSYEQVEEQQQEVADKKGKGKAAGGKRFEVKKWNAVAMWSWAICTDTCAICRNNLYEPSIEYQATPTGTFICLLYVI
jgi:RING-box protein 1